MKKKNKQELLLETLRVLKKGGTYGSFMSQKEARAYMLTGQG